MNKVKYFRNKLGLTVKELSDKAGVATGYISSIENDENGSTNPTKEVMQKIAGALEQKVSTVFFPD